MTLTPIASGSGANVALLSTRSGNILIDCGLPLRTLQMKVDLTSIDLICLTHEHADHSAGIRQVARTFNIPVMMSAGTFDSIAWGFTPRVGYTVGRMSELQIKSIRVSHDARDPRGFVFTDSDGDRAAYFVDLGEVPAEFGAILDGVRTLLIESNHDEDMIMAGPHHPKVKERCMGPLGHLSNNQVADFIAYEMPASVERLILGHVSKISNDPHLAYAVAKRAVERRGLNCSVEVACQ